jgi:hypothetical protein
MAFSFFKASANPRTIAVFDIGSASVGGALISFKKGEKPQILWSARESMVFQSDLNFGRFLSSMLDTLERVLVKMQKSGLPYPKSFLCIFSSPWYASQTRVVKMKRDVSFSVTKKGVEDLVEREIESFKKSHINKYKRMGEEEVDIMEIHMIQMKLNGYPAENPYGMRAKNLEMSLYISMAPKRVLSAVTSRVAKIFGSRTIRFGSFSLTAFTTIRDVFSHRSDFLFMDISGEVSDVSLVKNSVLLETASFPLGKNFLLRRIASGLNTVPEEVSSLFTMYQEGKATDAVKRKIERILEESKTEWIKSFAQALRSLSDDLALPNTIFFTSDNDVAQWFVGCLKAAELGEFTGTGAPFDVTFLDDVIMEKFSTFNPQTERDPFIIVESLFADRIIELGHL